VRFHGVLVEVSGVGVLLVGPSGVGKSECALDLVARGHRLVADDAVELAREGDTIVGTAAEAVGSCIEIRGLGILDVVELYGEAAYAPRAPIDLVCRLEPGPADFDSVGLEREQEELLGVRVPQVVLPSPPGAPLATIVDAAARDLLRRRQGPSAAARFDARLQQLARRP